MIVFYSSKFLRSFEKLPRDIQDAFRAKEKIFQKGCFDSRLRTHKLHGREGWSFLVTYSVRVIFLWEKDSATLVNIGDHSIYRK